MTHATRSSVTRLLLTLLLAVFLSGGNVATAGTGLLKGGVAESVEQIAAAQNRALGFATKGGGSATGKEVSAVFLGTAAFYRGLREGDFIVNQSTKESPSGLQSTITFLRDGKVFQISLVGNEDWRHYLNSSGKASAASASPLRPPVNEQPPAKLASVQPQATPSSAFAQLSAEQRLDEQAIAVLRNHDLVVLIDRSGSMGTSDCPQAASRWEWCRQQAMHFRSQVQADFPTGFSLVLFNNHQKIVSNADIDAIDQAFENNAPDGGTDTAGALACQLKAHNSSSAGRALIVVVITDGEPNDEKALRRTLISAANEATNADDISVVFLQVGEDNQAAAFLEDLDLNLTQEGAKFHIVHTVTFDALKRQGLLRAIAAALPSRQTRTADSF
jgi:Mg-chelatase subunit ChlD